MVLPPPALYYIVATIFVKGTFLVRCYAGLSLPALPLQPPAVLLNQRCGNYSKLPNNFKIILNYLKLSAKS